MKMILIALILSGCGLHSDYTVTPTPVPTPIVVVGPQGPVGLQGLPGEQGSKGDRGDQGIPGESLTHIQLCGSCVGAYPSVFPEYGTCQNGQLWGVYSANGGFDTLILPGTYSSNGINCSCSFIVSENCVVTDL